MAYRYLSATNPFLPVATGQVVGFIRDPKKFKINRYVQNIQSPAPTASYMKLDRDNPVRVVSDKSFAWADGDKSPTGHHNLLNFTWAPFQTERRAYPFSLGNQAISAANKIGKWDPVAAHTKMVASQAITNRTNRVIKLLQATANWPAYNTADANVLNEGAGFWDLSSSDEGNPSYQAIFKSIMAAVIRIQLGTNSTVQISDLRLILSPTAAARLAAAPEIREYMKGSPFAGPVLEGSQWKLENYGLPPNLYGIEVVVEDAVLVTDHPWAGGEDTALATRTFVKDDDTALLISRQGALDGNFGAPSFSTLQCYWYSDNSAEGGGELDVETHEPDAGWHKMTEGRCVEQFAEVLAAAPSGVLISNILST